MPFRVAALRSLAPKDLRPAAVRALRRTLGTLLAILCALGAGLWLSAPAAVQSVLGPAVLSSGGAIASSGKAPLVIVDAGHGGFDGGSVGASGTVEAPLNLRVARLAAAALERGGLRVRMTRTDEEALGGTKQADFAARRSILNDPEAALCVSIHMNAFGDRTISGPMAFYMEGSAPGEALAAAVIAAVCAAVEHPPRKANPGDYFVVRECACPAVLVECGFLSHAAEEQKLADPAYQQKLADGIAKGVLAYLAGVDAAAKESCVRRP